MRTILHYPPSDHYSTHSSHIAVAYSIIDFQRIFFVHIGGNRFPCCGSGPPIANIRNIPIAIYASMGLAASSFQRANRAVSLATVILSQMLKLPYDRGKMSSGRGWGCLSVAQKISTNTISLPLLTTLSSYNRRIWVISPYSCSSKCLDDKVIGGKSESV